MNELLLIPEEGFRRLGIGRAKGFQMLKTGELPSIKIGRLRRIPVRGLEQWVADRMAAEHGGQGDDENGENPEAQ